MTRQLIQLCSKCDLCHNMTISPIATEYFGTKPKVLIVNGSTPSELNDISQETISGPERKILVDIFFKLKVEFAVTLLMKCVPKNRYTKSQYKVCTEWIDKEIKYIQPKLVIGMGANVNKYVKCNYICRAPSLTLNNKKDIQNLTDFISKNI